jgi:hypothetical protein
MNRRTTLLVVGTALACAGACRAATLIDTDFAGGSKGWVLNGAAKLEKKTTAGRAQVLTLTHGEQEQAATVWSELKQKVPSFSFIADVRVRYDGGSPDDCPGDGFALAFAPTKPDAAGGIGGDLGLFGGTVETFTAFEVNTWWGQGLAADDEDARCNSDKDETFAFDVIRTGLEPGAGDRSAEVAAGSPEKGGIRIGQVCPPGEMKIVNAGWYRYHWNAAEDGTMTVYVTGLDDANKKHQKVKVLQAKFPKSPIDFEGRWGLTAGTGSAVQTVDVATVRVESPMIEP